MLKKQARLFTELNAFLDLLLAVAAFFSSYAIWADSANLFPVLHYYWILIVVIPILFILLFNSGLYSSLRLNSYSHIVVAVAKTHVFTAIASSSVIYLFGPHEWVSRRFYCTFIVLSFLFLTLHKFVVKSFLSFIRAKGLNFRNILLIGTHSRMQSFIRLVEDNPDWGLKIAGLLLPEEEFPIFSATRYAVLGPMGKLVETCKSNPVDEVIFCLPHSYMPEFDRHLQDMKELGINVRMLLDYHDKSGLKKDFTILQDQVPMLTFYCNPLERSQLLLKRCIDLLGSVIGLAITAILFPFIALAIKVNSPGPVLFNQTRVGENGRMFKCWKFRSMHTDAEQRKKDLLHLNEMNGAIFKIKDDPRVTSVGRFLRKTSLDELPQFWNVFCGEMSLVGTRPPTPDEVSAYENWQRRRISIKPGITGLWQVSGRNMIHEFNEIVRLDITYIEKWSIWFDLKILFKTVWVVFARMGSY